MKAVLPVAGSGTRMYPLGITTPKCLIPILNKPLLVWSLEALRSNGIKEVVLVISAGKFGKVIRDFVETQLSSYSHLKDMKVDLAIQEQQLGTAHVLQMAKDFFKPGEEFVFMYGDDLYGPNNVRDVIKTSGLAVVGMKVDDPEKWGIFQTDDKGKLKKVIEKPSKFVGDLANIGCMKLNTQAFELFDQLKITKRGEYELTDTLQLLADQDSVTALPSSDYWIPIGYPWHILQAIEYFLPKIKNKIDGKVEAGVITKGKVILPKSSTILAGTRIEGDVCIGENVTIGPNAYLRENVVIGDEAKIGFAVEIKNSVIEKGSKISHMSYISDSVIGKNCNLAAGTVTANWRHDDQNIKTLIKGKMVDTMRRKLGTILGDNVKTGVNTSIYPGRKIWPNLTTLPGQVVDKDLTA